MHIRTLLAALVFAAASLALPAAADAVAGAAADRAASGAQGDAAPARTCLVRTAGRHLAQIDCCKGHKGICGCRAGKIVCCDGTVSTEPGCTCRSDDPVDAH